MSQYVKECAIRLCNSFVSIIVHSWNLFSVIVSFHFQILDLVSSRQLSMKKKFHYERKDRMHDIGDKMTALLLTIKYCYREDVTEKMIASGITLNVYIFIKNWRQFSFYKQYFQLLILMVIWLDYQCYSVYWRATSSRSWVPFLASALWHHFINT